MYSSAVSTKNAGQDKFLFFTLKSRDAVRVHENKVLTKKHNLHNRFTLYLSIATYMLHKL